MEPLGSGRFPLRDNEAGDGVRELQGAPPPSRCCWKVAVTRRLPTILGEPGGLIGPATGLPNETLVIPLHLLPATKDSAGELAWKEGICARAVHNDAG